MFEIENVRTFIENIGLSNNRAFCRDIVSQVMDYCKGNNDKDAKKFKTFRKNINVAGFRPGKVPDNKFVEEISRFKDMQNWLLELLLSLWEQKQNEIMEVGGDIASSIDKDQYERLQEIIYQSGQSDTVEEIRKKLSDRHPAIEKNEYWLSLCLTIINESLVDEEVSEIEMSIDEKDDVEDDPKKNADELDPFWQDCLAKLSTFPVSGSEWKQINAFISETEILRKKIEQQEEKKGYQNWLDQNWDDLNNEFEEQIIFFDTVKFNKIILKAERDFESVSEAVKSLAERFREYYDLDKQYKEPSVTLAERRVLREKMNEVEDHIQNLNEVLEGFIDISHPKYQKETLDDTVSHQKENETFELELENDDEYLDEKQVQGKSENELTEKDKPSLTENIEEIGDSPVENELVDLSIDEEEDDDAANIDAEILQPNTVDPEIEDVDQIESDDDDDDKDIFSFESSTLDESNDILGDHLIVEWTDLNASNTAEKLLKGSVRCQPLSIIEIILKLIDEGRAGLALQISRCQDHLCPDLEYKLHPWLIECHMLNQQVLTADGQIPNFLLDRFIKFDESIFHPTDRDWNHLIRFFALSISLRSVLIAPLTGAADVIRQIRLKKGLQELYQLTQSVANFPLPLDLFAIKKVQDKSAWDTDIQDLQAKTKTWFEYSPQLTTCFSQATKVWRKWLERGNEVQTLLEPVIQNDPKRLIKVKEKLDELCDRTIVAAKMEQTRFELIKIKRKSGRIVSRAQNQFYKHLNTAISLAKKWVHLQENNPNEEMNYALSEAYKLKDDLISRKNNVLGELSEISDSHSTIGMQAGCSLLRAALEDLYRLFDPKCALPPEVPDPFQIFNQDLLKTPIALLDEDWEPQKPYDDKMLDALLELAADDTKTLYTAFKEQVKAQNHRATRQILEIMRANTQDDEEIAILSAQRDNSIAECRDALKRDIEQTVKTVEGALAFGFLNESDRNELIADINGVEDRLERVLVFSEVHSKLGCIRSQLEEKRNTKVEEAKNRLSGLKLNNDSQNWQRISQALDGGDVLTANEYIDMVDRGENIPKESTEKSYFTDFFIDKIQGIEAFFKDNYRGDHEIIRNVRHRSDICGLDMRRASKDQAVDAAEMLKAWFSAKRNRTIEVEKLHTIFRGLGFGIIKAEIVRKEKRSVFQMETVPIRDRNLCPVPAFGSGANGHYRVFCVWDRPSEEDLINEIGETLGNLPVLVLYFGRVFLMRRRRFPRICRERRRTLLLLDDTLLIYLAAEREARIRAYFECTLPFTVTEPYTITAGLVPSEMFYGRRREREEIVKPSGSCFIYGGRQLGKTALLRDIVREFHMPAEGKHAIWIDLKTEGIGLHRPINDIWETLIKELKKLEVIPAKVPLHTGWNRITDHVEQWLQADSERKIIFLLDEADLFLKSDADEKFSRVDQLKGLMDKTNRRFKVVFAGLHDVLRTTNQPNQALAHYGEPICIGPLLNDGEWREARSLVEKPLAALGYRFESPDLVTRILSRTNYYPSLIQLYCHQLLKHLSNPHEVFFDPETTPSYTITSFHVDDAYQSQELRKAIRDRFIWTLDLDPRYRLIAFAIANYCYENLNGRFENWFEVEIIKDESLNWWAKGFQQTRSTGGFKVLLDEMVGLGVLRKKEDIDLYALRSPNVVSMIGTEEEIQNELLKEKEPPLEYEAATFRAAMNDGKRQDPTLRSPLTAQQEFLLKGQGNGICIIFGSRATGIDRLNQFLTQTFGGDFIEEFPPDTDKDVFQHRLKDLNKRTKEGTTLLVVVPWTCEWDKSWIEDANNRLKALLSKKSSVRIAFIADPGKTLELMHNGISTSTYANTKNFTTIQLTPWHDRALRQWLEACNIPVDADQRKKISKVTCNWPIVLDEFRSEFKNDQYRWPESLNNLANQLSNSEDEIRKLGVSMGIDSPNTMKVIDSIGEMGEATIDDLAVILDEMPLKMIKLTLNYSQTMNLIQAGDAGGWTLDPLVERIRHTILEDDK